jgi:hypothetical protein
VPKMSELNNANATTNSYLELRKAKIERNKQVLESLGLGSSSPKNNTKAKPMKNNGGEINAEVVTRTRRSSRLRSSRTPDFDIEKSTPEIQMDSVTSANGAGLNEVDKVEKQNKVRKRPWGEITHTKKAIDRSEAKPGTTRATNIDIKQTLCGHFDYPLFVGRRLTNTGKAAAVEHAALMCGIEPGLGFSKYSGVCEFRNDAIFLWVNIGVPDADVKNEFLDSENEGKQVSKSHLLHLVLFIYNRVPTMFCKYLMLNQGISSHSLNKIDYMVWWV